MPVRVLVALSALWFLAMAGAGFWVLDGVAALDARAFGYDPGQVRGFLAGLDASQTRFLLGPMRWMDTVFPPLFALTLWRLGLWPGLALLYLTLDWAENIVVAAILRGGVDKIDPGQVQTASGLTMAKYAVLLGAVIVLVQEAARWMK